MGHPVVETVISALQAGGIRAAQAWPGERIPHLTSTAAAVCLEKVDAASDTTTVLVTAYAPGDSGGVACETAAAEMMSILQENGAVCLLEACRYEEKLHLFSMKLHALYKTEPEPEAMPFQVKLGSAPLECVTAFKSWRLTEDPTAEPLSSAVCYFRIEEQVLPGSQEQNTPSEPFTITVNREGTVETFTGCRMTADVREDGINGVHRVRSGTAEQRTFTSIL